MTNGQGRKLRPEEVQRDRSLMPSARALYRELWYLERKFGGNVFPSIATLARRIGYGLRQTKSALDQLRTRGLVSTRKRGFRMTLRYVVKAVLGKDFQALMSNSALVGRGLHGLNIRRGFMRLAKAGERALTSFEEREAAQAARVRRQIAELRACNPAARGAI